MDNPFIKDCQALIKIPSLSGLEKEAALFIKSVMDKLGYDKTWIDDVGNVIGLIQCGNGTSQGPTVMLEGHMDTVGADESAWTFDPFGGAIEQSRIYGRGTSDMKCALMAMVYAGHDLIAEKSAFEGTIAVVGTVCEEEFEGVGQAKVLDAISPDLVIIGEASQLNLAIGQRGRAEVVVETLGKSAHSSHPEAGINAVNKMTRLLPRINAMPMPCDPLLGPAIIEVTDIVSYPYPGASVIPSRCRVTLDRRTLPKETCQSVLDPIEQMINSMAADDPDFRARTFIATASQKCYTGSTIDAQRFFPAWKFDADDAFIQNALAALHGAGITSALSHYSFCTNASQSAGVRNIPCLGFGPSREDQAHVADEYVEIRQLETARTGYAAMTADALTPGRFHAPA